MNPVTPLKLGSILFAIHWIVWMAWWNESFGVANIVIFSVFGAVAGWLWFLGMRWSFRRAGLLPRT